MEIKGVVPIPSRLPPGCAFHTRCVYRRSECERFEPEFIDTGGGHYVACPVRAGGRFLEEPARGSA